MKRGKGICVALCMALVGGMTGAVVSASADAGGHDRAGRAVIGGPAAFVRSSHEAGRDSGPFTPNSVPGSPRGGSGGAANGAAVVPRTPSPAAGRPGGGNPQSQGGRGGNPPASGSGGGSDSGGDRGQAGGGSSSSTGSSDSTSGGSGGSAGGGASHGRGSGSGSGNSNGNGGGNGGGHAYGGQRGRCATACHIAQQPGTASGPTTGAVVVLTTPPPTPASTPAAPPVIPRTNAKPAHRAPPNTYSSSASSAVPAGRAATTTGVAGVRTGAGVGATVSPALRAGALPARSGLSVGTPSSILTLLGSAQSPRAATGTDHRVRESGERATVTQPIAQQTFIGSIEQAVPPSIWLALAVALAFGAVGTGWALHSGHRVRRQAGALAAISTAAITDQLTGVLNRRGFLEAVEAELARARRYGRSFVLAYVDVRGLKGVNDTEGHRAGDELLKEAARLLEESARSNDVVGRLGGDEMGLLLVEQSPDGADAVRRRVESRVPERRAKLGLHSPWDLTIGTAAFPGDGETVDDLLRAADLRLYEQRGIELIDH